MCRRITGNDTDALDATQDALVAIVRGLPRFDGRSAFSTWSYRIAVNACLDELRRRRRRPITGLPDREPSTAARAVDGPTAGSVESPIEGMVAARLDVDAALATLPAEFRAAVVLRDLCDLDYAEIGEVLGIPPGTVRSRIARGRAALADRLAGNRAAAPDRPTTGP